MLLTESEQLDALRRAMMAVGLTLMRQELSPFERALVNEVESLLVKKGNDFHSEKCGPWWMAGPVICRDDKEITIEVFSNRGARDEQLNYSASLCRLLNRVGPFIGETCPDPV